MERAGPEVTLGTLRRQLPALTRRIEPVDVDNWLMADTAARRLLDAAEDKHADAEQNVIEAVQIAENIGITLPRLNSLANVYYGANAEAVTTLGDIGNEIGGQIFERLASSGGGELRDIRRYDGDDEGGYYWDDTLKRYARRSSGRSRAETDRRPYPLDYRVYPPEQQEQTTVAVIFLCAALLAIFALR